MLQLEVPPPPSDEPPLPPRHQPRERWRWAIRKTIRIVRAVSGFLRRRARRGTEFPVTVKGGPDAGSGVGAGTGSGVGAGTGSGVGAGPALTKQISKPLRSVLSSE